jgi:5-methylcytosine-specific restriction endonuclease McrA
MIIRRIARPWEIAKTPNGESWQKPSDNAFYHSAAWRKLRKWYIQQNPICVRCEAKGIIKEANVVDHINPILLRGQKLDAENLQSLCTSCHNSKSAKERRTITR